MVKYTEGSYVNIRKQKLHTVLYVPVDAPVALLVWHHGYGEHVGRYTKVFTKLAEAGVIVLSYDAHGHGKSEPTAAKQRAVIWQFSHMVDDLYEVLTHWASQAPAQHTALPKIMGGQSLGGLVAAYAVLRQQADWAGLILHSAALDVEWTPVLRMQAPVSGLLAKIIPLARIVPAVRPEDMSQDPQVVADYVSDPLNTVGPVPVRSGAQILGAFRGLTPSYSKFQLPILAVHGTVDKCTRLQAVQNFVKAASSTDKTLVDVEGGYHELLHGPEAEASTIRLADWVKQHATSAPRSSL